ncbi:hypothetical protein TI39_contig297g00033 [Zymoseptoria brevis]|uniref:Uncharacterized protein n=1 Tax=Zymoseptoria brevis TaxID=1047168 RepID=A0A0F4GV61_9PEZI|nr:hypothetical protein TI39_contig297g00033 [Zymoseptoria brevis]
MSFFEDAFSSHEDGLLGFSDSDLFGGDVDFSHVDNYPDVQTSNAPEETAAANSNDTNLFNEFINSDAVDLGTTNTASAALDPAANDNAGPSGLEQPTAADAAEIDCASSVAPSPRETMPVASAAAVLPPFLQSPADKYVDLFEDSPPVVDLTSDSLPPLSADSLPPPSAPLSADHAPFFQHVAPEAPRRVESMEGSAGSSSAEPPLQFASAAEASEVVFARRALDLPASLDDHAEVEKNAASNVRRIIAAFEADYRASPPNVAIGATESARWIEVQQRYVDKVAQVNAKQPYMVEAAAWTVLQSLIDMHQLGRMRTVTKWERNTKCSVRLDAIIDAIADYTIIRFDVVRLVSIDDFVASPSAAIARKSANWRGNTMKVIKDETNQIKAKAVNMDYQSVVGTGKKRKNGSTPSDGSSTSPISIPSETEPEKPSKKKRKTATPQQSQANSMPTYATPNSGYVSPHDQQQITPTSMPTYDPYTGEFSSATDVQQATPTSAYPSLHAGYAATEYPPAMPSYNTPNHNYAPTSQYTQSMATPMSGYTPLPSNYTPTPQHAQSTYDAAPRYTPNNYASTPQQAYNTHAAPTQQQQVYNTHAAPTQQQQVYNTHAAPAHQQTYNGYASTPQQAQGHYASATQHIPSTPQRPRRRSIPPPRKSTGLRWTSTPSRDCTRLERRHQQGVQWDWEGHTT